MRSLSRSRNNTKTQNKRKKTPDSRKGFWIQNGLFSFKNDRSTQQLTTTHTMEDKKRIEELEGEIKAMEACFEHIGAALGAIVTYEQKLDGMKEMLRDIREMITFAIASTKKPKKKILNPEDDE